MMPGKLLLREGMAQETHPRGAASGLGALNDARDGRKVTPERLAVGVGFRKACTPASLGALVREAWRRVVEIDPSMAGSAATLVTIAEKDRPILHAVAAELGWRVLVLPKQALTGTEDRITVASPLVNACMGIPSVAEAAALAAAGPGSRLLLARMAVPDATCAIAIPAGRDLG